MAKREAEINITGNTKDAQLSIRDLENFAGKSFADMAIKAEKESKEISQAFKDSGIRTEKAIKESTQKAKRDYEKIRKSGIASANDIKRAYNVMAAKIKRNNRELVTSTGLVSKALATIKRNILLAATAAGALFGVKVIAESVKFESALLDLQKVLTDAEGNATQFSATVDELSKRFGISATAVLQGAANFKQAGFDVRNSFLLQEAALKLVIAGDLEAAEASELLVSALKGFKAPASDAIRLSDALNEVSNKYATNLKELTIGVAEFSPVAKKMGFTFEETIGAITPIIEVFRSGSESSQALRTGLLKLIDDAKPVQDALFKLGVSQKELNGDMRSGKDILFDVAERFKTLDENQKLVITSQIVGRLQAAKMVEVFDGLTLSAQITSDAMNSVGSINKEVAIRLGSTEVKINKMKTAFNSMAKIVGDRLVPAFRLLLDIAIVSFGGISRFVLRLSANFKIMQLNIFAFVKTIATATDFLKLTTNAVDIMSDAMKTLNEEIAVQEKQIFDLTAAGIAANKITAKAALLKQEEARKVQELIDVEKERTKVIVALKDVQDRDTKATHTQTTVIKTIAGDQPSQFTLQSARKNVPFVGPLSGAEDFERRKRLRAEEFAKRFPGIVGFKDGGGIPGYGGGDKVPALLESGEHVIKKESIRKLGRPAAEAFNRGDIASLIANLPKQSVQRYADGGEVSNKATMNLNLSIGEKNFAATTTISEGDRLAREIKSINVRHGRRKGPY